MKKILEITLDDSGKFAINTEFNPIANLDFDNPLEVSEYIKVLDNLVECIIHIYTSRTEPQKSKDISQILKALSITEIASNIQPYECAEQLWSTMMFSFLPAKEKQYRKLKEQRGLHAKVIEPQTMSGFNCMPMKNTKLS